MVITQKDSSTSSSKSVAGRFVLRCAAFFAPLAAALVFSALSLKMAGELDSPAEVVTIQSSTPALYYPLYQPKSAYPAYKLEGARRRQPSILILGSSRGFSIRGEFARDPHSLYNATLFGADQVGIMRRFLEHLPQDRLPRTVIWTVDPWWFHSGAVVAPDAKYFEPATRMEILDFAWRNGISWGVHHRFSPGPANLIGANAKLQHSGLRPDGSFQAGERWLDTIPNLLNTQLSDERNQADPWFHPASGEISAPAIDEARRFLAYCKSHGIEVIGYMSTFHPALYAAMRSDPRLDYYWRVGPALAPIFRENGAEFFEFQDPAQIGCAASEYLDAFHESEVCTIRVLLTMSKSSARIRSLFDVENLQRWLDHRTSDWQLGL
jgi:hypothetical protein